MHEPDKYRLEYVQRDGSIGSLSLLAIDVIHDLALVHSGEEEPSPLDLALLESGKGDRIYSLGNPHDLGMTVIEGTFNGLVENSRYRKILFSGSLNAGMSGGPAFNAEGEVMGINVSKGGEAISFLVPVAHLSALMRANITRPASRNFTDEITAALLADQQRFYQGLLSRALSPELSPESSGAAASKQMGSLMVPEKLEDSLKCWGHSVDEKEIKYTAVHQHCQSEDQIYISNALYVGDFNYSIELMNTQELNSFQFYNYVEQRFIHREFSNTYDKDEVSNFRCHGDTVALDSGKWKISSCFRRYRKYPGLYDASMIMASLESNSEAAVVKVQATGLSLDNAQSVFAHLAGAVKWIP